MSGSDQQDQDAGSSSRTDELLSIEEGVPEPEVDSEAEGTETTEAAKAPEDFRLSDSQEKALNDFWALIPILESEGDAHSNKDQMFFAIKNNNLLLKNATYTNQDGAKKKMKLMKDGRWAPEEFVDLNPDLAIPAPSKPAAKSSGAGIKASAPQEKPYILKLNSGAVEKSETLLGALWEMFAHWSFYLPGEMLNGLLASTITSAISMPYHAATYAGYRIRGLFNSAVLANLPFVSTQYKQACIEFSTKCLENAIGKDGKDGKGGEFRKMVNDDGTIVGVTSVTKVIGKIVVNFLYAFADGEPPYSTNSILTDLADARRYFSTSLIIKIPVAILPRAWTQIPEMAILSTAARLGASKENKAKYIAQSAFIWETIKDSPISAFFRPCNNIISGTAGKMIDDIANSQFHEDDKGNMVTGNLGALFYKRRQIMFGGTNSPSGSSHLTLLKNKLQFATSDLTTARERFDIDNAKVVANRSNKAWFLTKSIDNIKLFFSRRGLDAAEGALIKSKEQLAKIIGVKAEILVELGSKDANINRYQMLGNENLQAKIGGKEAANAVKNSIDDSNIALINLYSSKLKATTSNLTLAFNEYIHDLQANPKIGPMPEKLIKTVVALKKEYHMLKRSLENEESTRGVGSGGRTDEISALINDAKKLHDAIIAKLNVDGHSADPTLTIESGKRPEQVKTTIPPQPTVPLVSVTASATTELNPPRLTSTDTLVEMSTKIASEKIQAKPGSGYFAMFTQKMHGLIARFSALRLGKSPVLHPRLSTTNEHTISTLTTATNEAAEAAEAKAAAEAAKQQPTVELGVRKTTTASGGP